MRLASALLDAYSDQCSSAGFWPGGQGIAYPAFCSYASPAPPGFSSAPISPVQAFWSRDLNEYILPYDAVRTARDPEQTLMEFLTSAYEAAATTANWVAPPWNALSACLEFLVQLRGRDNGFGHPSRYVR